MEKAKSIMQKYPQFIPNLKFFVYDGNIERIHYHVVWPEEIWEKGLKNIIGDNNLKFGTKGIITPYKSKTVYKMKLKQCLEKLEIEEIR